METHWVPCLLCRGHWFLRCPCPFAPHTNVTTPALVTRGTSHCVRTARKTTAFPNQVGSLSHALCLPPLPAECPAAAQSWGHFQRFLSHHPLKGYWATSGAGALPPLELQGLPHLSSDFNLLQLVFFISPPFLIQVAGWGFILHRCV